MTRAGRLVLASGNAGKIREIEALLGDRWEVVPQDRLGVTPAIETGSSFRDNALLKARHAADLTGLPALADDSGLEVDALGGAPGVRSARYAGEAADDDANIRKLLAALHDVPAAGRTARFRCVVVLVTGPGDARPLVAEGTWEGRIAPEACGSRGFGYDPVFLDGVTGRSAAELEPAEKNRCSHRGQALARLVLLLGKEGGR